MVRSLATLARPLGLGLGAVAIASEAAHCRASRAERGHTPADASRGIVVLGFPAADDGSIRTVQRWRVDIALRTLGPPRAGDRVVFTGAPQRASVTEAAAMAAHAIACGLPPEIVALEERSRSTWENVEYALPLVEHLDVIAFASDPLHAARARHYARRQRPDLAGRLVTADDYRPGEFLHLKVMTAAYEFAMAVRNRVLPHRHQDALATRPE